MTEPFTFVLYGATGDLAKRKIYPALFNLFLENKLATPFHIIGLGRRELTNEQFRTNVEKSILQFSRKQPQDSNVFNTFLQQFEYSVLDVGKQEDYKTLLEKVMNREREYNIPENRMFYLSVAPEFFDVIAQNIKESGLGDTKGWKKLIIEKPFGHDLKSAQSLNEKLSESFREEEVYRIDHYLGKYMVQNIATLRFKNPLVESLWSNKYISNIQITAAEIVGVEERASYFDKSGTIRDMIQNHMLQMLMLVAMEPPTKGSNIRMEKVKALKCIEPYDTNEVDKNVVRGQYGPGKMNGEFVVGYKEEPGVPKDSTNDTFVAAKFYIENERWAGVPVYIRSGKRMEKKQTKIVVEFKKPQGDKEGASPNLLIININPGEGITYKINSNNPNEHGEIETVHVDHVVNSTNVQEGYERLIHDAILGNSDFFSAWEEVEYSWKLVEPMLHAFASNHAPLYTYAAGTDGPEEANMLLKEDGFSWN
ncbi:glucose-6-phosphate dehydrogenase [Priestia filamentosa]|uniref:glucose-6-phosphate dehydrogenase n=1 Tax=Priestia filamentosa TaxID=1402861 RepID=UPI003979836F